MKISELTQMRKDIKLELNTIKKYEKYPDFSETSDIEHLAYTNGQMDCIKAVIKIVKEYEG